MSYQNWREEPGLRCSTFYKKKFAFWPVSCVDFENKIWLKSYYAIYHKWAHSYGNIDGDTYGHTDLVEYISEEEYIVRKIAGKI